MAKEDRDSQLERFIKRTLFGGAAGGITGALTGRGALPRAAIGAALGGSSQAIGDAALGTPDEGESGFGGEAKRGAVGGLLPGAVVGGIGTGLAPGGAALVKRLIQNGMSKKAAIALILGSGAVGGAGAGALSSGLDQGLLFGLDREE